MTSNGRGRFIVFEGLDGAGTTTQLALLAAWLRERGIDVETTKEPSDGVFGRPIRQVLEGKLSADPVSLALAFAADRIDHIENAGGIRAALEAGRWVLSDRYALSSIAYQGSDGLPRAWLQEINGFAVQPDLTVFIDTDPEICMERIEARGATRERFEGLEQLRATFKQYRLAIEEGRFVGALLEVDGNGSKEAVFEEISRQFSIWLGALP